MRYKIPLVIGLSLLIAAGGFAMGVAAQDSLDLDLTVPDSATVGEETTIAGEVTVPELIGDHEADLEVRLLVDGEEVGSRTITIQDGETTSVEFAHTFEEAGERDVTLEANIEIGGQELAESVSILVDVSEALNEPGGRAIEGASFKLPDELQDDVEAYRDQASKELAQNAVVVGTEDELFVVFTTESPRAGHASVEGLVLEDQIEYANLEFGVMVASQATFSQDGTPRALGDVADDPDSFAFDLIEVTADHRSVAVRTDVDGARVGYATTTGVLVEDARSAEEMFGALGAQTHLILEDPDQIDEIIEPPSNDALGTVAFETMFWMDTAVTVDGIVLPANGPVREYVDAIDTEDTVAVATDQAVLHVVQTQYPAESVDDISEITTQPAAFDGSTVTLQAEVSQLTISVRETLEEASGCGTDLVQIQGACVEVPQDVVLHGGVAWTELPQSEDDLLFVMGASSWKQGGSTELRAGEYQITGEIVSTDRIDESLPDGAVLVVYEMERTGDLDLSSFAEQTQTLIDERSNELREVLLREAGNEEADLVDGDSEEVEEQPEDTQEDEPDPTDEAEATQADDDDPAAQNETTPEEETDPNDQEKTDATNAEDMGEDEAELADGMPGFSITTAFLSLVSFLILNKRMLKS